jgi:ribosome-associated toxin RatA of RatAB toxin-antitoxin module
MAAGPDLMRHVRRSAIVPHTPAAMFDLVADIDSYPQFLPGCTGATVHAREGDTVVASLALAQGPLKTEFGTRNVLARPSRMAMTLTSGPFRALQGAWTFAPLGESGCRVELDLSFEFDSRMKDMLLGPAFEALCNQLVDAFVKRARTVHR